MQGMLSRRFFKVRKRFRIESKTETLLSIKQDDQTKPRQEDVIDVKIMKKILIV